MGNPQKHGSKKKQNKKGKISTVAQKTVTKDHDQVHDDLKNKHKFKVFILIA